MSPEERRRLDDDLARLARGERGRLDSVYGRLAPPVHAFCRAFLAGSPDAEDAAQEALVRLFGQLGEYQPGRDGLSWAFTIAAWECRSFRRRRTRDRSAPLARETGGGLDPHELLDEKERAEALEAATDALRDADRETLAAVLDELSGDAAFRKRKERMIDRLRALVRRTYDLPT